MGLSCPPACGILVPRPGIKPTTFALEGGFLTTGPPGKSLPSLKSSQQRVVVLTLQVEEEAPGGLWKQGLLSLTTHPKVLTLEDRGGT